jgi:hypothetical protein
MSEYDRLNRRGPARCAGIGQGGVMGAYMLEILKRRCPVCRGAARFEVFNTRNSSCGAYCKKHGQQEVDRLNTVRYREEVKKVTAARTELP